MRLPTRFPTIIGLILTICIVGSVIVFTEQIIRPNPRASSSSAPVNVTTTNVSDESFTVTWTTKIPATGALLVNSEGIKSRLFFDDRDSAGKMGKYLSHSITVRDVTTDTQYSYKLLSNGSQYQNNGEAYIQKTPKKLSPGTTNLEPAYGIFTTNAGVPIEGALIYLTVDGGQTFSSLTKSSGLWLIPLSQIRTQDLSGFIQNTQRMTETITTQYGDVDTTVLTDTMNDSPVPEMIQGKSYDLKNSQINTAPARSTLALANTPGAVLGKTTGKIYSVALTQPPEGAMITSALPLVTGTGIPGVYVGISLGQKNPMSASVKVDSNGLWNYTPTRKLGIGKQRVTILTTNAEKQPVAITHTFEILKSGTQVLGDATPSATLAPTETPTETPTEEITVEPTATLSAEIPPDTGTLLPTIVLVLLGLGLLASGAVIVAK